MNAAEVQKMYELEGSYWWFVARRELAYRLLRGYCGPQPRILDIGCGTGAGLRAFARLGPAFGLDVSALALSLCRARGQTRLTLADAQALPFRGCSFDAALMLDVLEHVDDDAAAVREAARVLRPGGVLILTVPAVPALWSEHDEALAHRRRYLGRTLLRATRAAGLHVALLSYAILALFWPIFTFRLLQRLLKPRASADSATKKTALIVVPRIINDFFVALLRVESMALTRLALPFGVSLVAVARKRSA